MKSVFLVDDSTSVLMSLKRTLETAVSKTRPSSDGQQALTKIKGGLKPDLIITDINMPHMDSLALIAEARKVLLFTSILALTADSQQGKGGEAEKPGAAGWLVKPVVPGA